MSIIEAVWKPDEVEVAKSNGTTETLPAAEAEDAPASAPLVNGDADESK